MVKQVRQLTTLAVLLGLAVVFSITDKLISGAAFPFIPGLKIGLANIVVLLVIMKFKVQDSLLFVVLKSLLANFIFAGLTSFIIGGSATLVSYVVMLLAYRFFRKHVSAIGISVLGSFFHIVTQLIVIALYYNIADAIVYYSAILILVSLVTGVLIGILVNRIDPLFEQLFSRGEHMNYEKTIFQTIKKYDTIIIHRHSRPDGDAMGSQIGLREALKETFPKKHIYAVGDDPGRFSFIGTMDEITDDVYEGALVFVLDTSSEALISDERYRNGDKLIKIDHHTGGEDWADINYVEDFRTSCAVMIANFIFNNNMKLNAVGAKALMTGIITDSGRFMYGKLTPELFNTTATLLTYDFKVSDIYNTLYTEDLKFKKLKAQLTLNFKTTEHHVAYNFNTQEFVKESGFDFFTISRGTVNVMAGIEGIPVWTNFTEDEDGKVIAELRSRDIVINHIAMKYGGGGHRLACGATLNSFEEAEALLKDLDNEVANYERPILTD